MIEPCDRLARSLLTESRTALFPNDFVARHGEVFAVFDAATQGSGNVSWGVRAGGERLFVKSAGPRAAERAVLPHAERCALLRNAVCLHRSVSDPALPALRNVVESPEGPLLVYTWVDGELLRTPPERRGDPAAAHARFLALPWRERASALDTLLGLHAKLAQKGWIAGDFYDGCLLYDFTQRRLHVVDLDHYRDAPYTNGRGRMFGSTRLMAPEEHQLGARIDERTTVFNLGRALQQLLPSPPAALEALAARACEADPNHRFASVADLHAAWGSIQ